MANKIELNIGDEIYVNGKWYWDVINVDTVNVTVKIYYTKEYPGLNKSNSSNIKIPIDGISVHSENNGIKYCLIGETLLKKLTGGLYKILKVQSDISDILESANKTKNKKTQESMYTSILKFKKNLINEDGGASYASAANTSGMGDMTTTTSPDGTVISSDTATTLKDVATPVMPNSNMLKYLKKNRKSLDVSKSGNVIKESTTDDFKTKLFAFLDYPWQEDVEISVIKLVNEYRNMFVKASTEQIQNYLRNLLSTNDFEGTVFNQSTESFATEYRDLCDLKEEENASIVESSYGINIDKKDLIKVKTLLKGKFAGYKAEKCEDEYEILWSNDKIRKEAADLLTKNGIKDFGWVN